jgi:hypothetical protein
MANTIPASEPAPDIGQLMAGQQLDESIAALFQASNWAQAYAGSGTPRIQQAFPLRHASSPPGAAVVTYTSSTAQVVCEWKIPDTRGATSVDCYIYAKNAAGILGTAEFRAGSGGVTGVQALTASWALYGPLALTVDTSGGSDVVQLWLDANGTTISIGGVMVMVPAQASLAAGADGAGAIPFDEDEHLADETVGSYAGAQLVNNLTAIRAIPHVYVSWSGVENTALGNDGRPMVAWPHIWTVPVWEDTARKEWTVTVNVRATEAASATVIGVVAVDSATLQPLATAAIDVGVGTATAWYSQTMTLPRRRVLRNMTDNRGDGWGTVALLIWTRPSATDADVNLYELEGAVDGLTTAEIRGVCVWGV